MEKVFLTSGPDLDQDNGYMFKLCKTNELEGG